MNHLQILKGSFSAVSTPIFASKFSLELAICSKRRLRKGTALAEIYTMHSFAPFWNRIPKTTPLHRFGIESQKPGKPWGEKNLVQPREKLPGEAHKQLSPRFTQCTALHRSRGIRSLISIFSLKIAENFADFLQMFTNFARILLNFC